MYAHAYLYIGTLPIINIFLNSNSKDSYVDRQMMHIQHLMAI